MTKVRPLGREWKISGDSAVQQYAVAVVWHGMILPYSNMLYDSMAWYQLVWLFAVDC